MTGSGSEETQSFDLKPGLVGFAYSVNNNDDTSGDNNIPSNFAVELLDSLPSALLEEMRKHRVSQLEWKMKTRDAYRDRDLIFASEVGTPLDPRNVSRSFYAVLKKTGIGKRIRFHDLRGTAATLALEAGASVRAVQGMLGHATARLTLELYAKVSEQGQQDLAQKMDSFLFG